MVRKKVYLLSLGWLRHQSRVAPFSGHYMASQRSSVVRGIAARQVESLSVLAWVPMRDTPQSLKRPNSRNVG